MTHHVIRLRGPWQFQWQSEPPRPAPPGRLDREEQWNGGLPGCPALLHLLRRFNRPTGLGPDHVVSLIADPRDGVIEAMLNAQPLPIPAANRPFAFDISTMLQPRNVLRVTIDVADPVNCRGSVLEFANSAHLQIAVTKPNS